MNPFIAECRKIAKKHDFKVLFGRLKTSISGLADCEKGVVTINRSLKSRQEILSTLAHEYFHILSYRQGLWKSYYETDDEEERLKTALRCERWVDKNARNWLFQYDKRINYLPSYENVDDKEAHDFLKNYYTEDN